MMNTPYMQGYYPNNQMQQPMMQQNMIEQRLQALQNQLNNSNASNPTPANKLIAVTSIQEAQNAQIPMDGSTTYFVFGDTILAKNWSFATGKIENIYFKKSEDITKEETKTDRLAVIETKLDQLLGKYDQSTNNESDSKWIEKLGGKKNDK